MAGESANQLISVVSLLGAAIVAVPIFKRLGLGSVLGYLAAGVAIGPLAPEAVEEIAEVYFKADRHSVRLMAEVYDPNVARFKNKKMIKISQEQDELLTQKIQAILQEYHQDKTH